MSTICAIATALDNKAISIIKLSGNESLIIINKLINRKIDIKKDHNTIKLKKIFNNNEQIDQVLVSYFKGPNSYTGEDVVEINCHGGIVITQMILKLLLKNGCEMAKPGEFTQRAYLNGKINFEQIEIISNLINAENEKTVLLANKQYANSFTRKIQNIREKLINKIAEIEVGIDYPEYEETEIKVQNNLLEIILKINDEIKTIKKLMEYGQVLKEGVNVAIVGLPNSGKSTLMNTLSNQNIAIVTNIEGTTTDVIKNKIKMENFTINLIDTAGIRKTKNEIEKIGVEKTFSEIEKADIILHLFDLEKGWNDENTKISNQIKAQNKKEIIIGNKNDLKNNNKSKYDIAISAKKLKNINEIENKIIEVLFDENFKISDNAYFTQLENIQKINEIIENISQVIKNIELGFGTDFVVYDLEIIHTKLGEIINEGYDTEIIDKIFSQYCLGK